MSDNEENLDDNSIETTEDEVSIPPPPSKFKGKHNANSVSIQKPIPKPEPKKEKSEETADSTESDNSEPISPIIKDIAANSDLMAVIKARAGDFAQSQEFKSVEFQYKEACRLIALNEKFIKEMEDNGVPTPEQKIRWDVYQSYFREKDDWTNKKLELQGRVAQKLIGTKIPIPQ